MGYAKAKGYEKKGKEQRQKFKLNKAGQRQKAEGKKAEKRGIKIRPKRGKEHLKITQKRLLKRSAKRDAKIVSDV